MVGVGTTDSTASQRPSSAGANGDTATQMDDVLGITMDEPHSAVSVLVDGIEQRSAGSFTVANSLWTQNGLSIEATSARRSSQNGAGLVSTDFLGDPIGALDDVNGWAADATAGRIPPLLDESQRRRPD